MNWTRFSTKVYKTTAADSKCGSSFCYTGKPHQNSIYDTESIQELCGFQPQRGGLPATSRPQDGLDAATAATSFRDLEKRLIVARNAIWRFKGNSMWSRQCPVSLSRQFGHKPGSGGDSDLNRDFLVRLWVADRNLEDSKRRRRGKASKYSKQPPYHYSNYGWCPYSQHTPVINTKQPPPSQSISGFLKPESPEEVQVMPLLARSNMLITRDIEWANLVLGFEQENRYAIVDVCYPQSPVGLIREQSHVIARQLLRLRRPFVAYITDAMGNELFRVRRPFWWITSSIYAEINGKEVGVVHRRWHLWKRVYDLYLGDKQFAVVENPGFWNWTFTLKDINGEVLAQIDRDWRGFGFEIFTDAGQYVIRFGSSDPHSKTGPASMIEELEVIRPLTLLERAVAVALAISLDNDYFSRHGGWGLPFVEVGE